MQSGNYYYGSGTSQTAQEARDQALNELNSQIVVRVASSFQSKILETSQRLEKNVNPFYAPTAS